MVISTPLPMIEIGRKTVHQQVDCVPEFLLNTILTINGATTMVEHAIQTPAPTNTPVPRQIRKKKYLPL